MFSIKNLFYKSQEQKKLTYVILTCPEDKTATEYNFFLQMLQVFAIQIAPADGKLLFLVDHIMG